MTPRFAKDAPEGFVNSIKKVAIVGAGGHTGRAIAEALLKTGNHTVTAITRAGSNSSLPEGLEKAIIDYKYETSLVAALKGQDFLVITMSLSAPQNTHSALLQAAVKAGVQYVMPNAYSIHFTPTNEALLRDIPVGNIVLANIAEVESLGMTSVALMCGFWYEYSLKAGADFFGFDLDNLSVTLYDDGKKTINVSTWAQCGRAVASLLSLKKLPMDESDQSVTMERFRNKTLLVSSFKVSQRDMLDSLESVTGTTDKSWRISYESTKARYEEGVKELSEGKQEAFYKSMYARVFYPSGDADFESHNSLLGLQGEDLDGSTRIALSMKD